MVRQGEQRAACRSARRSSAATLATLLVAANYTRGLTELFAFMALLATVATLVLYLVRRASPRCD